jgi:Na+-driven multidrug efflux pump
MPAFAVGMAVSTMAAQNVGARKWDRVNSIARVGVVFSVVLIGSLVLIIELLDTHAFQIFLPAGSEALRRASHLNHIVTWSFVFFGVTMVLFGVVRATGAVMAPLLVLTVTLLLVRFPLAEAFMGRYQIDAVWWSFPISSALSAALAVVYYKYGGWRAAHMAGGPGPTQNVVAPES